MARCGWPRRLAGVRNRSSFRVSSFEFGGLSRESFPALDELITKSTEAAAPSAQADL
jgi:hypothetical protein